MVLFVADRPSPRMKPGAKPFEGAACEARLKTWIKSIVPDYSGYALVHQSDYGAILEYLMWAYEDSSPVIALGLEASKALKNEGVKHFRLPHPSGRNRQINNETFINEKLEECKKYIERHKVYR